MLLHFWKSPLIFKNLKKDESHSLSISEIIESERGVT